MSYAKGTSVPAERSRMEIEKILMKHGAVGFYYGAENNLAMVGFKLQNRCIKMRLPLPIPDSYKRLRRNSNSPQAAYEAEVRRRWRCLLLSIKAKLEAVETGITTIEDEFLAHVMVNNGRTIGEEIRPQLEGIYSGKSVPLLLEGARQ